jgi:predicted phosphodiesterase
MIEKNPTAILCGDIHLREDIPVCRLDDYEKAQWRKLDFISDLQKQYNCAVLHSGDLFHHWKPSPYLIAKTIEHIPNDFITCFGNHDLPQHNLELINKCGTNVLAQVNKVKIAGVHFGQTPTQSTIEGVLLWHVMTFKDKEPYLGCKESNAIKLLKMYPWAKLICTGDNHQTFIEEYEGRLLVNPGSMMRMTVSQIDHKPCVFLWYAETNTVEQVFLPIEEGVVTREHIVAREQRDERIDAFISKLSGDYKTELSFQDNLTMFFNTNEVSESVKQIIYKSIDVKN